MVRSPYPLNDEPRGRIGRDAKHRRMSDPFNVVHTFCGAGGLSLGFDLLHLGQAFRTVLAIDVQEPMARVFNDNHEQPFWPVHRVGRQVDLLDFCSESPFGVSRMLASATPATAFWIVTLPSLASVMVLPGWFSTFTVPSFLRYSKYLLFLAGRLLKDSMEKGPAFQRNLASAASTSAFLLGARYIQASEPFACGANENRPPGRLQTTPGKPSCKLSRFSNGLPNFLISVSRSSR